jgi:hypothetical protein
MMSNGGNDSAEGIELIYLSEYINKKRVYELLVSGDIRHIL